MEPIKKRSKHGPEYTIQRNVIRYLKERGWHIERIAGGVMQGGAVQSGLPDLFVCHNKYGTRFVELKNESHFVFTTAQKWKFPLLMDNGCGIWILTEASDDQYKRLFAPPNLWDYLDRSDCLNQEALDDLLKELDDAE